MLTELGESEAAMEEVRGYGLGDSEEAEIRLDREAPVESERRQTMRFVDEFREPELITRTADEIRRLADPKRHYRFMEVCGGHTHSIYRFGLKDLLPAEHRAGPRAGLSRCACFPWEESTMASPWRSNPT